MCEARRSLCMGAFKTAEAEAYSCNKDGKRRSAVAMPSCLAYGRAPFCTFLCYRGKNKGQAKDNVHDRGLACDCLGGIKNTGAAQASEHRLR